MVHMCEMIISSGVFFQFENIDFLGCQGNEIAKNDPTIWQKFLSVLPYISGTICHMIFNYGIHVCIKG